MFVIPLVILQDSALRARRVLCVFKNHPAETENAEAQRNATEIQKRAFAFGTCANPRQRSDGATKRLVALDRIIANDLWIQPSRTQLVVAVFDQDFQATLFVGTMVGERSVLQIAATRSCQS